MHRAGTNCGTLPHVPNAPPGAAAASALKGLLVRKALLVVVGLALAGIWYAAIGGKKIDESHVRQWYADYLAAFDRQDGKAACALFDAKVSGRFRSGSPSIPVKEIVDKASVCAAVDEFHEAKRKLEAAAGTELYTNFELTVNAITISPDRKTATAEVLVEMRVGTAQRALLDMRSTQTDVMTRHLGKTRVVQSDGVVRFFR